MTIQRILLLFPPKEKNILRAIKAVNEKFDWVSDEAIGKIARYFDKSESHIFSVASFYDEINLEKPAPVVIEICDGANCQTKSADNLIKKIESFLKLKVGNTNRNFSLNKMSCVGRCVEGPVAKVNGVIYTQMTADKVIALIQSKFGY